MKHIIIINAIITSKGDIIMKTLTLSEHTSFIRFEYSKLNERNALSLRKG